MPRRDAFGQDAFSGGEPQIVENGVIDLADRIPPDTETDVGSLLQLDRHAAERLDQPEIAPRPDNLRFADDPVHVRLGDIRHPRSVIDDDIGGLDHLEMTLVPLRHRIVAGRIEVTVGYAHVARSIDGVDLVRTYVRNAQGRTLVEYLGRGIYTEQSGFELFRRLVEMVHDPLRLGGLFEKARTTPE